MNEITRIHIAKTAYDIEIAAKKQLEKYIKSLEVYTQDSDVIADIEIRMTELLAERGVKAGGVISSEDVNALRTQLGEPYEFADEEGDIAVGPKDTEGGRRLYRSTDDAVLGGVLSGMAAFFNVNPLWTRLIFVLLLFISVGFVLLVYIVLWIVIPPARTATQKLQLAGKDVTVESIKDLNLDEETAQPNRVAPVLQQILSVGFGTLSAFAGLGTLIATVWILIAALTFDARFVDITNGFVGLGDGATWIVWAVFWIVIFGLLLLTALFGLIAYAFYTKKITKKIVVSGVIIVALGLTSFAAAVGISATQSWRVANETRSMVHETKANLPAEFKGVRNVTFDVVTTKSSSEYGDLFGNNAAIRYVVDEGPARYELSALPNAKTSVVMNGTSATVTLTVPESFRNSFVQPILTVYGPALDSIVSKTRDLGYAGLSQANLAITAEENTHTTVSGTFTSITVTGSGSVDLGSSSVQTLTVQAQNNLNVLAGTVRTLTVTQPDVCPSGTYTDITNVTVTGVTSGSITYNGAQLPAQTHRTNCASVIFEELNEYEY